MTEEPKPVPTEMVYPLTPAESDVSRETEPCAASRDPDRRGRGGGRTDRGGRTETWPRPAATRVLTVANQKGGVGKTTTTVNIAAALALHGLRVLVIDLDPQGNASTALAVPTTRASRASTRCWSTASRWPTCAPEVAAIPGLPCVPATIDLAGAEIELVSLVARESRLQRALTALLRERPRRASAFDYVFIDCPPSLGLLTVNAFVAASEVLIPIQCEYYALEGLGQLIRNVELVQAHLNPDLHVSTILLTMYDGRTRLAAQVADEVRSTSVTWCWRRQFLARSACRRRPVTAKPCLTYDPGTSGALSYLEAAREMAHRAARPARRRCHGMTDKKRGLGRGLGRSIPSAPGTSTSLVPRALIPGRRRCAAHAVDADCGLELEVVHTADDAVRAWRTTRRSRSSHISPNPRQPRQVFEEESLAELVFSLREVGLLQPIVVRPVGDERYELVAGERRWRAAQQAGFTTIPAIVRETDDDVLLRDALLENLHRAQLNPLEEAAAYGQLLSDFGCTQDELAHRIGRSRPQVTNTLRLLRLPAGVQRRVAAGVLSAGHARALLALDDASRPGAAGGADRRRGAVGPRRRGDRRGRRCRDRTKPPKTDKTPTKSGAGRPGGSPVGRAGDPGDRRPRPIQGQDLHHLRLGRRPRADRRRHRAPGVAGTAR